MVADPQPAVIAADPPRIAAILPLHRLLEAAPRGASAPPGVGFATHDLRPPGWLDALGITFITLRRRSQSLLAEIAGLAPSAWHRVPLDVPARKYKTPRVFKQPVTLEGSTLRQLFILDLGHEDPTILLSNDWVNHRQADRPLRTAHADRKRTVRRGARGGRSYGGKATATLAMGKANRRLASERFVDGRILRRHGVSYWMFVRWRQRIECTVTPASPLTLIPVVAPMRSGGAITIRLPDGIGIEVEPGFDAGVLSAVVRAVQVSASC